MSTYRKPEPQGTEPLATEHLNLRKFKDYDATSVHKWSNDPAFLKSFMTNPSNNEAEARDMIRSWRGHYSNPDFLKWCMANASNNQAVGEISASIDMHLSCAEVEYAVSPTMRGRGYAVEALSAVITYLHDVVGVHRVVAQVNTSNSASAKAAEKAGMVLEGILSDALVDRNGEFYDVALYAHVAEPGGDVGRC